MRGREKATQEGGEDAPNSLQVRSQCPRRGSGQTCHSPPNKGSDYPAPQVVTPATATDGEGRARPEQLRAHSGRDRLCQQVKRFRPQSSVQKLSNTLSRLGQPCFLEPLQ